MELLVALAAIAILTTVVLLALNPRRQLAQGRNVQRRADLSAVLAAAHQYVRANRGAAVPGVDASLRMLGTDTSGCAMSCGAGAVQTFDVQPGASADAHLDQAAPSTPHGGEARIQVYPWAPAYTKRSLIRFDISNIPPNATITSAQLFLFEAGTYGTTRTISAHRITRSWTEAGATWQRTDGTTPWSTPGGDFVSAPTATTTISWDGVLSWHAWDVTSDVAAFVGGTQTNSGWLLKDTTEDSSQAYWFFESREGTNRPYLRVQYTEDGGEPTAASCLDLQGALTPRYAGAIPLDPLSGTSGKTQYAIKRSAEGRYTVKACNPELGEQLTLTQ